MRRNEWSSSPECAPAAMRAAIYARFSSDLQDARSLADQIALVRNYASARPVFVVATYEDAAISGSTITNHPGIQRLGRLEVFMQRWGSRAAGCLLLSFLVCADALPAMSATDEREVIASILAQRSGCSAKPLEHETYLLHCPWRPAPYIWRCRYFEHGKCDIPRRPKNR